MVIDLTLPRNSDFPAVLHYSCILYSVVGCLRASAREHISETARPVFTSFVHVTDGRGSFLVWRRCDMIMYIRLFDDVVFSRKWLMTT